MIFLGNIIVGLVVGLLSSFIVALSLRSFPLYFVSKVGNEYYLIENNTKRKISSMQSKILELKFGSTIEIKWRTINFMQRLIFMFLPVKPLEKDFVKIVKVKNGKDVYLITNFARYYIQDMALLKKYDLEEVVNEKWPIEKIERFPLGEPILIK